jgi:hypothetical protein
MRQQQARRPSEEQREVIRDEIAVSPERAQDSFHRKNYQAWCAANQMPEFPADAGAVTGELVLLRFLHSTAMARGWGHGTCSNAALVVAQHLMRNRLSDPRGPQVKAWLKARLRETGKRTTRPVDALALSEVRAAVTRLEDLEGRDADAELLHQRAFLALADLLDEGGPFRLNPLVGADPERCNRPNPALKILAGLTSEDFTVHADELRVRIAGTTQVVLRARTPEHYAMLATAALHGGPHPLCPKVSEDDDGALRIYWERLRRRATVAAYVVAGNQTRHSDRRQSWAARWWVNADREHRVRLMALMDIGLPARAQDAAYLLTGLTCLFRDAELVRLNIGDVARRPDGSGFDYALAEHKSAMHAARHGAPAQPLEGALEHEAGADGCLPVCAACAMDRHLQMRAWRGATPKDPLFVAYNSRGDGDLRRLASRQYGTRVVKQAASSGTQLEDGSDRRLGTRSLRVSGATWLHQAGVSYQELQEVGTWSSVLYARLYVRRYDPWASGDLVLGLSEEGGSRPNAC